MTLLVTMMLASLAVQPQEIHPYVARIMEAERPADASVGTADPGSERVCRREQVIGSNRFRRVCTTKAIAQVRRERTQQDLERKAGMEPPYEDSHHNSYERNPVTIGGSN